MILLVTSPEVKRKHDSERLFCDPPHHAPLEIDVEAMAAADRAIEESQRVTQELRQPLPSLRPQMDSIVEWIEELEHRA